MFGRRVAAALLALGTVGTVSTSAGALSAPAAPPLQYGINTYVTYHCQGISTYLGWATNEITQFKALGANSLGLAFPLYTNSLQSNNVFPALNCKTAQYQTPPLPLLVGIVAIAHAHGMQVLLRPLVDQLALYRQSKGYWRGLLSPTSISLWMTHYEAALRPYLLMAQADKVEHVAVESELNSIANRPSFATVIGYAKTLYKGDLSVNYTWTSWQGKRPWPGTSPGIDTYPRIPYTSVTQSATAIKTQWDYLYNTYIGYNIPNITAETIDEVGLPAQDGAYRQPSLGSLPLATHPFDQLVQERWFSAGCGFMKEHGMRGIYFWGEWMATNRGNLLTVPNPQHPGWLQPQTQLAIKGCFATVPR